MESVLVVAASIAVALLLGRVVHRWLGFVTEVESVSMIPSLASGQRVLARRQGARRPLRRGDIVVVDSAEIGRRLVKRVVGLPGERLDIGADGRVQVSGRDLVEPYVVHRGGRPGVFHVPAGHLLLLGDNRTCSSDARAWREPYLPVTAVLGRVVGHRWSSAAGEPEGCQDGFPAPAR